MIFTAVVAYFYMPCLVWGCVKGNFPDHLMKAKEEMPGGSPSPCWLLTLVPGGECGTKARENPETGWLREWDTEMVQ